jgi:hypothetical protein
LNLNLAGHAPIGSNGVQPIRLSRIGLPLTVSRPDELDNPMPRLTNYPNVQIDSVHCRAICEEIGYRLRQILKNSAPEHPPHLKLLDRLRQKDFGQKDFGRRDFDGAPSIVPSFNDTGSGGSTYRTSTPLRKRTGG